MTSPAKRLIRAETTKRVSPPVTVAVAPKRKARVKAKPLPAFVPYRAPEPETYPQGQWPLLALRTHGQCHFPTGRDGAGRQLFCGEPAPIGPGNPHGSWREACRSLVFGEGTVSERDADRMGKETRS